MSAARSIETTPPLLPLAGDGGPAKRGRMIAEWSVALAALALVALTLGQSWETVVVAATLAAPPLVVWIVVQDLRSFTIADGAVVALALLALATRLAAGDSALLVALDVLLSGGVLLAFREIYYRRRGIDGLGLGDVKLAAAGGLLVGASAFAWALLAASLVGLVVVALARGRAAPKKLAFGAVLAPAIYVAWLAQALPILQGA